MTHTQKALQALRQAGSNGIHSFDLCRIIGTNFAPRRVLDLRRLGYKISSHDEKRGNSIGCRYVLDEDKQPAKKKYVFDPERQVYIYG